MAAFLDLNDNCIALNALTNKTTEAFVNDATVTVTISDAAGVELVSAQSMPYVSASDGVYRAIIASTVSLGDDGDSVTVTVNGTAGDGSVYQSTGTAYVKSRKLLGF